MLPLQKLCRILESRYGRAYWIRILPLLFYEKWIFVVVDLMNINTGNLI